jgi:hypothetical protein
MRKDDTFMGRCRRLKRVIDRRLGKPGWLPWLTNVPLAVGVMVSLNLLMSMLVGLLSGSQVVKTIMSVFVGFFSYYAAWIIVGWLHVKRVRWVMRRMW